MAGFECFSLKDQTEIIDCVGKVIDAAQTGELSLEVAFVDDTQIKKLNANFAGKDASTDVLTFCAHKGEHMPGLENILGEIIISLDKAKAQAKEFKHSLKEEVAALVAHGLCHLLGLDHEKSDQQANIQAQCEMTFLDCADISPQIALCGRV